VLEVGGFDLKRALELEPDFLKEAEEHEHEHEHEDEDHHEHEHDHHHDEDVGSVGISTPGDLDEKKLSDWLGTLLRTKGQDIFRMKGVLAVKGRDMRFVFQGVHMLMDGRPDRPWGAEPRHNTLVFHRAEPGSQGAERGVQGVFGVKMHRLRLVPAFA
jgi:G3E family GTPase